MALGGLGHNSGLAFCGYADVMLFGNRVRNDSDFNEYKDNVYRFEKMDVEYDFWIKRHSRQSRQLADR